MTSDACQSYTLLTRFLKDKKGKKRKKKSNEEDEAYRALYKQDKVAFGDVVQAPPKLSSKPKGKVCSTDACSDS